MNFCPRCQYFITFAITAHSPSQSLEASARTPDTRLIRTTPPPHKLRRTNTHRFLAPWARKGMASTTREIRVHGSRSQISEALSVWVYVGAQKDTEMIHPERTND